MRLIKMTVGELSNIYSVDTFEKELKKAIDEKWSIEPPFNKYQKKIIRNLAVLEEEKEKAVRLSQFEKLESEGNLYSIRFLNAEKNLRIIYTIVECKYIILLYPFIEKNSNDYKKAIGISKNRIKELEM